MLRIDLCKVPEFVPERHTIVVEISTAFSINFNVHQISYSKILVNNIYFLN